jgi:putative ATP-binding cassette transporter
MKLISFLLRCSRPTVVLAILAGIGSGAGNSLLLVLMNAGLHGSPAGRSHLLVWFFALAVVVPLTRITSELLLVRLGQTTAYSLLMQLSRRFLAVPLRHLETLGAPRVQAVLTGDLPTIANTVALLPVICINLAVVAACLIYLGVLSWKVLLGTAVFIAIGVLSYQIPLNRANAHFRQAREVRDDLYRHFRGISEGSKELKLHFRRRQAFLDNVLHSTAAAYRSLSMAGQSIYTVAASWGQLLAFAVIGLIVFVAPQSTMMGLDSRAITGFALILLYLMTPLQLLMNLMPSFAQAEVALRRIDQMGIDLEQHGTEAAVEIPPQARSWRRLELLGVTHTYRREGEDGDFKLGPIDLTLKPGEVTFIAGGNGSGKTTLGKILVGLYPPQGGEIRIDGQPVNETNREAYRQYFSVVFSDFFLFDTMLGLEDAGLDEQARRYLIDLQLAHKVTVEAGHFSTTELSQGQRKRLALLTALVEDRPIYVFDEWAADQDPLFKDVFYREILAELKRRGKAIVAISHDDRYYHLGDQIVRLDSGKLVSQPAAALHSLAEESS